MIHKIHLTDLFFTLSSLFFLVFLFTTLTCFPRICVFSLLNQRFYCAISHPLLSLSPRLGISTFFGLFVGFFVLFLCIPFSLSLPELSLISVATTALRNPEFVHLRYAAGQRCPSEWELTHFHSGRKLVDFLRFFSFVFVSWFRFPRSLSLLHFFFMVVLCCLLLFFYGFAMLNSLCSRFFGYTSLSFKCLSFILDAFLHSFLVLKKMFEHIKHTFWLNTSTHTDLTGPDTSCCIVCTCAHPPKLCVIPPFFCCLAGSILSQKVFSLVFYGVLRLCFYYTLLPW